MARSLRFSAHGLAGWLPPPARRRVSLALAAIGRRPPVVGVVVNATGGRAPDLDRLLHALRRQSHAALDIVVSHDDGDALTFVASRHARQDWRVRTDDADKVRGTYVTVLRPTAGLSGSTIAALVQALEESGSDVAVASAYATPGPRLSISDAPDVLRGLDLGRMLFRRNTVTQRLGDPIGAVHALVTAGTFDVVADQGPGARPAVFGVMDDPMTDLHGWLAAVDRTETLLRTTPGVDASWHAALLADDATRFLDAAERMNGQQWSAVRAAFAGAAEKLDADAWASLPWLTRTKLHLALSGRRAALQELVTASRFDDGQVATLVRDGVVVTESHRELPATRELPDWCFVLSPTETALRASVQGGRWVGDTALEIELHAVVSHVGTAGADVVARAAVVGADGARVPALVEVGSDPEVTSWAAERYQDHDRGVVRLRLDAGELVRIGGGTFELTLETQGLTRTGCVSEVNRAGSFPFLGTRVVAGRQLRVELRPDRGLVVELERPSGEAQVGPEGPVLRELDVRPGSLVLVGCWPGAAHPVVELTGPRLALTAPVAVAADGSFVTTVDTRVDEWGRGVAAAPSGVYAISLVDRGTRRQARPAPELAARLPIKALTRDHRVRLEGNEEGELQVVLAGPLAADELGVHAQQRLQAEYARCPRPLDPGLVYLQAYTGQSATDSPLALHHELRRRRPDLRLVWAVADRSVWVPPGAETVLWGSRDWYDVLSSAALVISNIEMERWFRSRDGQTLVQTFHGYPSKSMGVQLWRSKGFTDSRIEQLVERTSRQWDLLLTPAPEVDRYYREEYRYDGEILAAGFPRNDALLAPDADQVRASTRARLGIRPGQNVVLYAPTWRDNLATNYRAAEMLDLLDVEATAEALGPDYVIAVRGHRFHVHGVKSRGTARVVDVTDHPEINDLILACDAAVLDYSSLRFDVAVVGRPMVFLVPDLHEYTAITRGFLYDFAESAPGPLVRTGAEVVTALRDLEALRSSYAEEYVAFNERFNRLNDGHAAERVVDRLLG